MTWPKLTSKNIPTCSYCSYSFYRRDLDISSSHRNRVFDEKRVSLQHGVTQVYGSGEKFSDSVPVWLSPMALYFPPPLPTPPPRTPVPTPTTTPNTSRLNYLPRWRVAIIGIMSKCYVSILGVFRQKIRLCYFSLISALKYKLGKKRKIK